jgi:beta-galactosidase
LERFKSDSRKAFYGKAMLIVQSNGKKRDITVTASSPKLREAKVKITTNL